METRYTALFSEVRELVPLSIRSHLVCTTLVGSRCAGRTGLRYCERELGLWCIQGDMVAAPRLRGLFCCELLVTLGLGCLVRRGFNRA